MKTVCVYCGSSPGIRPGYTDAAARLGEALASRGLTLVYGGSRIGLMGRVADTVLEKGGRAVGVLPEALKAKEVAHPKLTELHVVKDMHERKAGMAALSDAFVALPGGFGTLDEVLEMVTWNQLGLQSKPVAFLNAEGYYDGLFRFLKSASGEGFVKPGVVEALILEPDPERLVERLMRDPWPDLGAWPR